MHIMCKKIKIRLRNNKNKNRPKGKRKRNILTWETAIYLYIIYIAAMADYKKKNLFKKNY